MSFNTRKSLRALLSIAPEATDFTRRGFQQGAASTRAQLERSAATFAFGYNSALASERNAMLAVQLEEVEQSLRGFAYEGAGMGLALIDFFDPWKKRFLPFVQTQGNAHIYMLYIGWGWTMGRLPRKQIKNTGKTVYDPLLSWLAYDGYGFHEGFFSWKKTILHQMRPATLPQGYARRAFDQGLGRSLWFVGCGDIAYIATSIGAFPLTRQPDLWSGVGLACTYAGGVSAENISLLCEVSAPFHIHLAQGAAFALKARQRAGNLTEHTLLASNRICGLPDRDILEIVESSLHTLPLDQYEPAFELWRQRIQAHFALKAVSC
jgi:enediyne biosynthesis protein E3